MCRHMYLHRDFFYAVYWHKTWMSVCYLCCIRSRVHAYSRSRYHNNYRYVACRTPVTCNNSKLCHFEYCVRMNDRNHTNRRNLHGFEPHCDAIWQNKKNERTIHSWVESMVSFFPSRWWWKMRKLHHPNAELISECFYSMNGALRKMTQKRKFAWIGMRSLNSTNAWMFRIFWVQLIGSWTE